MWGYDDLIKQLSFYGFISFPSREQAATMAHLTLDQAYNAWCDYMAGYSLAESIMEATSN